MNDKIQSTGGISYESAEFYKNEMNSHEAMIKNGEILSIPFGKTDFDKVLGKNDKIQIEFLVFDEKGRKHIVPEKMEIEPIFNKTYQMLLTGNEKVGYAASVERVDNLDGVQMGTYKYEGTKENPGDFTITLEPNGTFSYYETFISSYIGNGKYTIEGDLLILKEEKHEAVQYFRIGDGSLSFIEKGSTNFIYVPLKDGTIFYFAHEADVDMYKSKWTYTFRKVPGEAEEYARRIGVKEEICSLLELPEGETEHCDFLNEIDYLHEDYLLYALDMTPKDVTLGTGNLFPELFVAENLIGKKYYEKPELKENLTEEDKEFLDLAPMEKKQKFQ